MVKVLNYGQFLVKPKALGARVPKVTDSPEAPAFSAPSLSPLQPS